MTKEQLKTILDNIYEQCRKANDLNEVPVAAALVMDDQVIYSHNHVEEKHDPFSHAEIEVIKEGLKRQNGKYLQGSTLVVSLEPCLLCMGAILKTRISNLYYVIDDEKAGSLSYYHVFVDDVLKVHRVKDDRFDDILSSFFLKVRNGNSGI